MVEIRANVSETAKKNLEQFCIENRTPSLTGNGMLKTSQGDALDYILRHLDSIPPTTGREMKKW